MIVCMLLTCSNCSGKTFADSLSEVAYNLYKTGDYAGALNSYIQLLKIAHSEKDCAREAYALQQVGRMHYLLRDINQAFSYSFVAINMAANCDVDSVTGKTLHFIGSLHQESQNLDSALFYYSLAKTALEGTRKWKDLSTLYGVLGELYTRYYHNDVEGKKCYDLCENYAIKSGDTVTLAFAYLKKSLFATMRYNCIQGQELANKALALYKATKTRRG